MRSFKLPASLSLIIAALPSVGCADQELEESPPEFRALEDGLLMHWTFEDRNGDQILDVSGNGRHGTVQGGGTFVTSPAGEALSLDGLDDYVSFTGPRSPALYGGVNGAFTVSARVKVDDVNKLNTLCYGCAPLNSMYVGTTTGNQVMTGLFEQVTTGLTWPKSTAALSNDTWVEVTMIVEGGVGTRYYLGCNLDANVLNANVGLKDYNYSALGWGSAADRWFAGEVDELRVWDRALSEAEIDLLCEEPPVDDGLELHWTFEDRNGNQILDVSGNNRHGTLLNGGSFGAGVVGDAVSLDGVDDYISFSGPRDPALYGGVNGDFTVSSRVRVADLAKDNTLCNGCGPFNSLYVGTASQGARAMAAIYNQTTTGLLWPKSTPALSEDTWVEVTMVVDGGVGTRYYLDCTLDSERPDANVGLENYNFSAVGYGSSPSRWFGGEIDELRVWSRALSQAEIADLCPDPLADGLQLHYTFEDRSGNTVLDVSGNDRHGTLQGGGSFVAGPFGEAVSLDGVDDYISLVGPRDPALYGGVNGDFTINTRVRVADIGKDNTLCYGCGPFNTLYIGTASIGARAMAAVFDQSTNGVTWPWSTPSLPEGDWVDVTMVVEGGVATRFYRNCSIDSEVLDPDVGLKNYGSSTIGRGSSPSRWFAGDIDELRIWNRALSGAEIATICPSGLANGLMLHYTFEHHDGNTITDLSGNGRHGTLLGGAYVSSPYGEAVQLDGIDDRIVLDAPTDPALYGGPEGDFTLSTYLRVDNATTKRNTFCIGCGPFMALFVGGSPLDVQGYAEAYVRGKYPKVGNGITNHTWVEVTMVLDGGVGVRFYLDGLLRSEMLEPSMVLEDRDYHGIGDSAYASQWFRGEIDELRIWNRALSDAEIAQIVAGRPALRDGLHLYWTFENHNNTGNVAYDMAGNNHRGSAKGTYVALPFGEAISLDGVDDRISIKSSLPQPRDPALYGGVNGTFTVSSRLRVTDVDAVNTLCQGCGPFNAMYVGSFAGGNRVWAELFDQNTAGLLTPMSSSSLVNDTWVEVTMTVDGATGARLYLDCTFDSELLDANVALKDYGYTAVGEGFSANTWYGGELDNFRVWTRVLTEEEIAALCQ